MDREPDATGSIFAICGVRDIPNRRSKGFHLLRRTAGGTEVPWHIFVIRWDRNLFGYVNACPHQGSHLDWEHDQFLDPDGAHIVCGKHGALFEIATGECVDGPCRGRKLETVRLAVVDGDICVAGVALAEADENEDDIADGSGDIIT